MSDQPANDGFKWTPPTERNPETAAKFKHDSFWQITFPVLAAGFVVLGLAALLLFGAGRAGASAVADFSLILLLLITIPLLLPLLILPIYLTVLLGQAIEGIPPYTNVAQKFMKRVSFTTDQISTQITHAVIALRGFMAGAQLYLQQRLEMMSNLNRSSNGGSNGSPQPPDKAS